MPTWRQHDHDGDTPDVDQTTPTVITNDVAIILIQRDRQHGSTRSANAGMTSSSNQRRRTAPCPASARSHAITPRSISAMVKAETNWSPTGTDEAHASTGWLRPRTRSADTVGVQQELHSCAKRAVRPRRSGSNSMSTPSSVPRRSTIVTCTMRPHVHPDTPATLTSRSSQTLPLILVSQKTSDNRRLP